jgi:hypothetical protein
LFHLLPFSARNSSIEARKSNNVHPTHPSKTRDHKSESHLCITLPKSTVDDDPRKLPEGLKNMKKNLKNCIENHFS